MISEGRGTALPFQIYGHPDLEGTYQFSPVSIPGVSENPKFKGEVCHGENLSGFDPPEGWTRLYLQWLIRAYRDFPDKAGFFTSYFEKLAGTASLGEQIRQGWNEERIRQSWQEDLDSYKKIREKYLIYP